MKKLLALLVIPFFLLVFASCGAQEETSDASKDESGTATEATTEASNGYERNSDWAKAYARIIENADLLTDPSGIFNDWGGTYLSEYFMEDFYYDKYSLYDTNGDGTPELFMFLPSSGEDGMKLAVVLVYKEGDYPEPIGYVAFDRYNPETCELIEHGHWHGAGGSGDKEWQGFKINDNKIDQTFYIDDLNGEISIDAEGTSGSQEDYDKLYSEHVKNAEELSSWGAYDLTDPKGFDNFGGAPDNFYAGKELDTYKGTIENIRSAIENRDSSAKDIPYDLTETIAFSADSDIPCYYALYDLDENGVKELIVGVFEKDEESVERTIRPVGIYTIKEDKAHLFSELSYFKYIIEHKWIITYQGNGIQEGHEYGYCWELDDGNLKEVPLTDAAGGSKDFNWQRIK